ncbi:MAG: hypothetical protein IJ238_05135 [Acidaminococcaceae bacterium]|nr:hypothetical protein [Acidaminococcaceae bacterium]
MLPEWVEKHKQPGTTVKKIGKNYYLYYATSSRQPGKKYPVCEQTYIGKITPEGVIRDRVTINVGKTQARRLKDLVPNVEGQSGEVIALYIKKEWICTMTEKATMEELEKRGICHDGKVVLHNI